MTIYIASLATIMILGLLMMINNYFIIVDEVTQKEFIISPYNVGLCSDTLSKTSVRPWWIYPYNTFIITENTPENILSTLDVVIMPRTEQRLCWDTPVFRELVSLKKHNKARPMMLYLSGEVFNSGTRTTCNHLDAVIYRSLEEQQAGCPTIHFLQAISHEKQRYNEKTKYYPSEIDTLPKPEPRKKFCALITRTVFRRTHYKAIDALVRHGLVKLLSEYKQCERPKCVGTDLDSHKCMQKYKFVITMENTSEKGYFSEKLLNGALSNTMPIYFGAKNIQSYVNTERFVWCRVNNTFLSDIRQFYQRPYFYFDQFDKQNQPVDDELINWITEKIRLPMKTCIDQIIKLDQDDELYEKKRSQSIWNENKEYYVSGQYERDQLTEVIKKYKQEWI